VKQVPASCPSPPSCLSLNPFPNPASFSLPQQSVRYLRVLDVIHVDIHGFPLWVCVKNKCGNGKYHFQLVGLTLLRTFCACCDFIWWVSGKRCYHGGGEVSALRCVWETVPSVIIKIFHFLKSWIEGAAGWCAGEPVPQWSRKVVAGFNF